MATISVSLPSDGTTADVSDYNTPITTIVNEINGNLDNSNINASAAIATSKLANDAGIVTAKLADGAATPAKLVAGTGTDWAWQSWTPTWTNLTVASSTVTAKYIQIGKTVHFRVAVVLAGGNAPSGNLIFSLPVTSVSYAGTAANQPIGQGKLVDTGTASFPAAIYWATTTTASINVWNTSATYAFEANISATVPHNWANTDEIHLSGTYEAA